MTNEQNKIRDYLETVPPGEWRTTSEVIDGSGVFPEMEGESRRRAARNALIELVKFGHVQLSDRSGGPVESWQTLHHPERS
jgi:hypothetical protein